MSETAKDDMLRSILLCVFIESHCCVILPHENITQVLNSIIRGHPDVFQSEVITNSAAMDLLKPLLTSILDSLPLLFIYYFIIS